MSYSVGRGRPPKHSQFQKGVSGNPDGARRHDQDLKAVKRLTAPEIIEVANLILNSTPNDLAKISKDKDAAAIAAIFASIVYRGIRKGEARGVDAILDRVIGRPKYHGAITNSANGIREKYQRLTDRELEEALTKEIDRLIALRELLRTA